MRRPLWRRPDVLAAAVNAALVLLMPLAMLPVAWLTNNQASVSARVSPLPTYVFNEMVGIVVVLGPFIALAFAAGVRTFVHARRVLDGRGSGAQGIFEAAGLGFVIAIVVLLPGILTHAPRTSAPYILAYGGGGLILGLALGLVLFAAARVVLRLSRGQVEH